MRMEVEVTTTEEMTMDEQDKNMEPADPERLAKDQRLRGPRQAYVPAPPPDPNDVEVAEMAPPPASNFNPRRIPHSHDCPCGNCPTDAELKGAPPPASDEPSDEDVRGATMAFYDSGSLNAPAAPWPEMMRRALRHDRARRPAPMPMAGRKLVGREGRIWLVDADGNPVPGVEPVACGPLPMALDAATRRAEAEVTRITAALENERAATMSRSIDAAIKRLAGERDAATREAEALRAEVATCRHIVETATRRAEEANRERTEEHNAAADAIHRYSKDVARLTAERDAATKRAEEAEAEVERLRVTNGNLARTACNALRRPIPSEVRTLIKAVRRLNQGTWAEGGLVQTCIDALPAAEAAIASQPDVTISAFDATRDRVTSHLDDADAQAVEVRNRFVVACSATMDGYPDTPCNLPAGHKGKHRDVDGVTWDSDAARKGGA